MYWTLRCIVLELRNPILHFFCQNSSMIVNNHMFPKAGSEKKIFFQVITFIDLAGHEKYLKTTVFGMTGHAPDFAMLMVSSSNKLFWMAL